jgi:hypothetical protein
MSGTRLQHLWGRGMTILFEEMILGDEDESYPR